MVGHGSLLPSCVLMQVLSNCIRQQDSSRLCLCLDKGINYLPNIWMRSNLTIPNSIETLKAVVCGCSIICWNSWPLIPWFYRKQWPPTYLCRLISYPGSSEVVSKHFKLSGKFQPFFIADLLIQVVLHTGQYLLFIEPDHLFNRNIGQGVHFVQNLLELGILTKETLKTLVFNMIPYCCTKVELATSVCSLWEH